jgi:hypothetical protein
LAQLLLPIGQVVHAAECRQERARTDGGGFN